MRSWMPCGGCPPVDPMAGWLLRRQLRLAGRRRSAVVEAPPHELLGQRHGEPAGRPGEVRAEPVRHERFRAVLSVGRRRTVSRRESSQSARPGLLSVGRVLQQPRRQLDARRPAGIGRRSGSVPCAVLGRRKRVLGLRRQLHARRVRDRVSAFHGLAAALRCRPRVDCLGTQQRRPLLDASLPQQADRKG